MEFMFIYCLSQITNLKPETYRKAVVIAVNESQARRMHPDGLGDTRDEEMLRCRKYNWVDPDDVVVHKIGVAYYGLETVPRVVVAEYCTHEEHYEREEEQRAKP